MAVECKNCGGTVYRIRRGKIVCCSNCRVNHSMTPDEEKKYIASFKEATIKRDLSKYPKGTPTCKTCGRANWRVKVTGHIIHCRACGANYHGNFKFDDEIIEDVIAKRFRQKAEVASEVKDIVEKLTTIETDEEKAKENAKDDEEDRKIMEEMKIKNDKKIEKITKKINYKELTAKQLRLLCKKASIPSKGNKSILIARLEGLEKD